jgi:hypothetical protein
MIIMRKYFLTLIVDMAQFNPKEIIYHYRNGKPAYYSYDEELYCGTFPEEWAQNHLPTTGPKECGNCVYYGSWNGVFLGYCANCANYVYNGERGYGFIDIGRECDYNRDVDGFSIFDTYLKDVFPDDIGDKDFMDSFKAINNSHGFSTEDLSFEERYPDIDINEVNDYYDELFRRENELENDENGIGIGYTIDGGGYYGSDYDGGYDSY